MRRALTIAFVLVLALPASALAMTDQQFKHLADTKASGDGTPHFGLDVGGSLLRGVVGFAIVIGAILLISKLIKVNNKRKLGYVPRGRGRDGNLVEVLSTTPLGPNRQLHMVRVGDEVILVGSGEGGITPLRSFNEGEAVALGAISPAGEELAAGFSEALARAGGPAPSRRVAASVGLVDRMRALTSR